MGPNWGIKNSTNGKKSTFANQEAFIVLYFFSFPGYILSASNNALVLSSLDQHTWFFLGVFLATRSKSWEIFSQLRSILSGQVMVFKASCMICYPSY